MACYRTRMEDAVFARQKLDRTSVQIVVLLVLWSIERRGLITRNFQHRKLSLMRWEMQMM